MPRYSVGINSLAGMVLHYRLFNANHQFATLLQGYGQVAEDHMLFCPLTIPLTKTFDLHYLNEAGKEQVLRSHNITPLLLIRATTILHKFVALSSHQCFYLLKILE